MKGFLGLLLTLLLFSSSAFGQGTTTTVSRLQLDHPDLGYPGGTALHTAVANLYQKIGDNMNSRYKEFSGIAASTTTTWTHNLGVAYSEMSCFLYTGAAPSLTRVPLPISSAGWTIAANGTNPLTQVDITTPSSAGPYNFAVMCVQGYMPERVDDLKNVDLSSAAQDGQALVYNGTTGKWNAGASGDASFKLQAISTSTLTLKGGYLIMSDGRELATYSGSGSTSSSFGVDITANLSTVLGSSPANATTYYLYVDLSALTSTTTTDTGRKIYGVTSANLSLQTAAPDAVLRSHYVPIGLVRSATTGTAWTGSGSTFKTLAVRRHEDNPVAVSPTVYSQTSVVGSVGSAGQVAAGHMLTSTEWPFTTAGNLAYFNFNSSTTADSSGALSCSSGTAACTLTNNNSIPSPNANDILGNANSSITLTAGSSQYLSSTDQFFNPGNSTSFAAGGWFYASNWSALGANTSLIGQWPGNTDRGWNIQPSVSGSAETISFQGTNSASASDADITVLTTLSSGWHFFAISYNFSATTLKGYIDGKLVGSAPLANQRATTGHTFSIGKDGNVAQYFGGQVGPVFFEKGYAMTDDDVRKVYAATATHNLNMLPENQLWSATYKRADGLVAQSLSTSWLVSKDKNTLYYDLSDFPSTATVSLKAQDTGLSPYVIPARTYDTGYLSSAPSTTIAHGLGDVPTQVKVFYEETTGQFVEEPNGAYCSATSTNLVCDWSGLSISSSNRLRVVASAAMAPSVAVPPADATTGGILTTSAQTIAGAKTFSSAITLPAGIASNQSSSAPANTLVGGTISATARGVAGSTGTTTNVTSITLGAGTYLISANLLLNISGTASVIQCGINLSTSTTGSSSQFGAPDASGQVMSYTLPGSTSNGAFTCSLPTYAFTTSGTTLNLNGVYTGTAADSWYGFIQAVRIF